MQSLRSIPIPQTVFELTLVYKNMDVALTPVSIVTLQLFVSYSCLALFFSHSWPHGGGVTQKGNPYMHHI